MRRTIFGSSRSFKQYAASFDKVLLLFVLIALAVGMLAVNSATLTKDMHVRCLVVQSLAICIGLTAMFILSRIDYDMLSKLSKWLVLFSFVVLLLTAFLAENRNGNRNWLYIAGVSIQPSELTKPIFILTMSHQLASMGKDMNKFKNILKLCLHFAMYFIPIILQGDIGTAIVYFAMFSVMLFIAGLRYTYIVIGVSALVAALPIGWMLLKDYHRRRIIYGFRPELDPLGTGYQPLASRMAIGSGQLTGMGYGQGIQSQNSLLPEIQTDFIYAIIGEEGGFIASVAVILILLTITILIVKDGLRAKNQKGYLICIGVATMIMVQTVINIGMCIGVSPVIGITLPFISYGGSSVLSLLLSLGLVYSVCVKPDTSLKFSA